MHMMRGLVVTLLTAYHNIHLVTEMICSVRSISLGVNTVPILSYYVYRCCKMASKYA